MPDPLSSFSPFERRAARPVWPDTGPLRAGAHSGRLGLAFVRFLDPLILRHRLRRGDLMAAGGSSIDVKEADGAALPSILALYRGDKKTLGFMPDGAFEDAVADGRLLAATAGPDVVGYLFYRIAFDRASIAHLCVHPASRNKGVSRRLIEAVSERTAHLRGISLTCRRDYAVNQYWPHLGFVAQGEKPGRGRSPAILVHWFRRHEHSDLFSNASRPAENALVVVLDMNVFIHTVDDSDDDAKALLADWVPEHIEYYLTEEVRNEIARHDDAAFRRERTRQADSFRLLTCAADRMDAIYPQLEAVVGKPRHERDRSDLRQLARAIGGKAHAFLTGDRRVLSKAEDVEAQWALQVRTVGDFLRKIDEVERGRDYRPSLFSGTRWRIAPAPSGSASAIAERFQNLDASEKRAGFERRVHSLFARPQTADVKLVNDGADFAAVIGTERDPTNILEIPLLRVRAGSLTPTVARHLLATTIASAHTQGIAVIRFTDLPAQPETLNALPELGFRESQDGWIRLLLAGAHAPRDLLQRCRHAINRLGPASVPGVDSFESLVTGALAEGATGEHRLEKTLWPVKLTGTALPSFIVPIWQSWAEQLFDHEGEQWSLFGADVRKAFGLEAVYYRSATPRIVSAPGRIVWHVTHVRGGGESHVRATSLLDEVIVAPASELFRRFRRLGVYAWKDVLEKADGDAAAPVMAMRFSGTELFKQRIPWVEVSHELRAHGIRGNVLSAKQIPDALFFHFYRKGLGEDP